MPSPAPSAVRALADATARWPNRSKASDGIMGDAAHVERCEKDPARCEGHVLGNAFDVTHDPAAGVDGSEVAELARKDPRTVYVIWNRRIWSRKREAEGWRPYTGPNPHDKHVHVSIAPETREDASPWPWAPGAESATLPKLGPLRAGLGLLVAGGLGLAAWRFFQR